MTIIQSVVLGIVQGLGEFLPISSSAHLILVPWLLGWSDDGGLTFDIALHAGTLLSLLFYFRQEWLNLGRSLFRLRIHHLTNLNSLESDGNLKTACLIIVATIPTAIIGVLLEKKAESAFRNPLLVGTNLALMGLLLWIYDRRSKKNKSLGNMKFWEAFGIGIFQGLAVVPGVSRSGITITCALAQGFDRKTSARFSFFLCMPIIAGACILKLRHLHLYEIDSVFISGVSAAAISGYFAIGGLIRFLQTRSFGVFAIYRFAIGLLVWGIYFGRS